MPEQLPREPELTGARLKTTIQEFGFRVTSGEASWPDFPQVEQAAYAVLPHLSAAAEAAKCPLAEVIALLNHCCYAACIKWMFGRTLDPEIHNNFEREQPQWLCGPPTEPGYYFVQHDRCRKTNQKQIQVARVSWNRRYTPPRLVAFRCGKQVAVEKFPRRWSGPIPLPTE